MKQFHFYRRVCRVSLLPPHIYAKKNLYWGHSFLSVCLSMCSLKKCRNFCTVRWISSKILGATNILASNFKAGDPDPAPLGFRLGPQVSAKIYLLQGFWGKGVVLHLLRIKTTRWTKHWEWNFEFCPTAGENGAGRQGWPGGRPNFGISLFFTKGTPPLKQVPIAFCFMHFFDPTHHKGPTGPPGGVKNQKSKLGYFL